jgi:hypothetical protein
MEEEPKSSDSLKQPQNPLLTAAVEAPVGVDFITPSSSVCLTLSLCPYKQN